MPTRWNSALAMAALLCACAPPPVSGDDDGGVVDAGGDGCLTATLGPVTFNFQDDVSTHYQAEITSELDGALAPDFLVLQFFNYNERIGDLGVGTFPLDDGTNDNYGHCAECFMVFTDQPDANGVPARVFFQSGGTLTVERNPREGGDLIGRIDDLVLVESTIGGEDLASAPVPGGDCLVLGDVELDVKFVPQGWTCAPELYNAGDGVCDCACGTVDVDCFPATGAPTSTVGCGAEQVCTVFGCRDTCDAFAGDACPQATEVCAFFEPVDTCAPQTEMDPAAIGETCTDDFMRQWCAVEGTIPMGYCDFDADGDGTRTCRPRCDDASDCTAPDTCVPVVYDDEGGHRGYCGAGFQ